MYAISCCLLFLLFNNKQESFYIFPTPSVVTESMYVFGKTALLPLPKPNINAYFSFWAKC